MSLRAIASTMVILATGVASSAQCWGRLHDLCWLSIPGLDCMADRCWGIEEIKIQESSMRQQSSPGLIVSHLSSNAPGGDIASSNVPGGDNDTRFSGDFGDLPTMSVQWLNHAEFNLMESRGSQSFESYTATLLSGWEWFMKDLSSRLLMRRFVAEAAETGSSWLSDTSLLLTGLLGQGFDLLASVDPPISAEAIVDAGPSEKSDFPDDSSEIVQPKQPGTYASPVFVIYQHSGKDFLIPRNLIQNWNIVPDFGGDQTSDASVALPSDIAVGSGRDLDLVNHELNRAFQLTVASQLEMAAEKLLLLARGLKEQASADVEFPAHVAGSSSFDSRK